MKIIISESQLLEYMPVYANEKTINNILDKVSKDGQAELSDEEKNMLLQYSRGEKISSPKINKPALEIPNDSYSEYEDEEVESNLTSMFMDIFPETDNIAVVDENWYVEQEDDFRLNVENEGGIQFYIYPFSKEIDKLIIINDNFSFNFIMTKKLENYIDMRRFVEAFKTQIFPEIIRKVKQHYI